MLHAGQERRDAPLNQPNRNQRLDFIRVDGALMAIFIIAMQVFLAWAYRDSFSGVLQANAKPVGQA